MNAEPAFTQNAWQPSTLFARLLLFDQGTAGKRHPSPRGSRTLLRYWPKQRLLFAGINQGGEACPHCKTGTRELLSEFPPECFK